MSIKECIGCGFCCTKAKCAAGARLYPTAKGVCPALKWNGTRHVCDLMEIPGALGAQYRKELYAGEGCCMNLNSWRTEPLQDRTLPVLNDVHIPSIMQKLLAALGREMISGDTLYLAMCQFSALLQQDGMPKETADAYANKCIMYLQNQKSTFVQEFMG